MSDNDEKKRSAVRRFNENDSSRAREETSSTRVDGNQMRRINPLGFRVVVRIEPESDTTASGLYLPQGSKDSMSESLLATVIEVASATDEDTHEETNVSGIPLGAMVLIRKESGVKVPWDEEARIIDTKEVLALVDVVKIT